MTHEDVELLIVRLAVRVLQGRDECGDRQVMVDLARDLGCPIGANLTGVGRGASSFSRGGRSALRSLILWCADRTFWEDRDEERSRRGDHAVPPRKTQGVRS